MPGESQTTTDRDEIRHGAEKRGGREFLEKFDEGGLALVHQEKTAGGEQSNFNKLVSRDRPSEKRPR